jgi:hypothetical protein
VRVVNAFETGCCRRMLKIKWIDRITNDEVFQRAKEDRLTLQILKNWRHSWKGHTIKHNDFVVNIPWRRNIRKKGRRKTSTTVLKASREKHRSWQLYSNEKNGLQQFQMASSLLIKDCRKRRCVYQSNDLSYLHEFARYL